MVTLSFKWLKGAKDSVTLFQTFITEIVNPLVVLLLAILFVMPAFAHPGRTDGKGGHYDKATGEYHYHHGYPAHQHTNNICPYDFDDKTGQNSGSSGSGADSNSSSSPSDAWPFSLQGFFSLAAACLLLFFWWVPFSLLGLLIKFIKRRLEGNVMKALIWLGCIAVFSFIQVAINSSGTPMGGLLTIGAAVIFVFLPAPFFCRKYEEYKLNERTRKLTPWYELEKQKAQEQAEAPQGLKEEAANPAEQAAAETSDEATETVDATAMAETPPLEDAPPSEEPAPTDEPEASADYWYICPRCNQPVRGGEECTCKPAQQPSTVEKPSRAPIVILSLICVALLVAVFALGFERYHMIEDLKNYKAEAAGFQARNAELNLEIEQKEAQNTELQRKLDQKRAKNEELVENASYNDFFVQCLAGVIFEGDEEYFHAPQCTTIPNDTTFYVFSSKALLDGGFKPCPICHSAAALHTIQELTKELEE